MPRDSGAARLVLAVRSDLSVEDEIRADGVTWLDRRLVAKEPMPISEAGFGQDVRNAMDARADHLIAEGLARRQVQRFVVASNLLETLRTLELNEASAQLAFKSGLPRRAYSIAGVYRQRVNLASGRYAMIDDGLGFCLVP